MKSTGIIRRIDELGRIVIPMELRKNFGIDVRDHLEIHIEKDRIVLSKYLTSCLFCGSTKNVKVYRGKKICGKCCSMLSKKG